MTVAACADVHIANIPAHGGRKLGSVNDRAKWALDALLGAVRVANRESAALLVLGDLFDVSRPEPAIIARTMDVLDQAIVVPRILVGNHDMHSTAYLDNACSPLRAVADVYQSPDLVQLDGHCLWMVPFRPGPAREWLPEVVRALFDRWSALGVDVTKRNVLCIHLGIADEDTPTYLEGHDDTIHIDTLRDLCAQYAIHDVLAGNWHWNQEWDLPHHGGGRVVQVGTLSPVRHSDSGFEHVGGVQVIDRVKGYSFVQVPGPRFATARSATEVMETIEAAKRVGASPLFLRTRYDLDDDSRADLESRISLADGLWVVLKKEPTDDTVAGDEPDISEEVARLSDLPIDDAIFEVAAEVAESEGVSAEELHTLVDDIWRSS